MWAAGGVRPPWRRCVPSAQLDPIARTYTEVGIRSGVSQYQPGVCNIGPAEIARRRTSGHLAALASVALLSALVAAHAPRRWRLLVVLPAAASASGYIQAQSKFCAGFGSRGQFNFGLLGQEQEVEDPEARALDVARSRRMGLQSLGIGVAVGGAALVLPV